MPISLIGVPFEGDFRRRLLDMATIVIEQTGFRIWAEESGELEISSWGFWDAETAVAFENEALATCRKLPHLDRCEWNASEMKPQAEHGQIAIRKLMIILGALRARDCRIFANNALTMMQLKRLALECGLFVAKVGAKVGASWT